MSKNNLNIALQKQRIINAKLQRLTGTIFFFLIMFFYQATAQNLNLQDVTVSDESSFTATSITAGPNFTVTETGAATFNSQSVAIKPKFFIVKGGAFFSISNSIPVSVKSEESILPDKFTVYQNYPNPFNPETEIRFALPKESRVVITIHNALGQRVRNISDRQFTAGTHIVKWNGKNENGSAAASGLYIYKVQADGFSGVKKMSLIR